MKMRIILIFTINCVMLPLSVIADEWDKIIPSVVYLHQDVINKIKVADKELEVWLKDPVTGKFIPQNSVFSGTGFFVSYMDNLFLVTADHVAARMSDSARIIISTQDDHPRSLPITDLLIPQEKVIWISHPLADVAVMVITTGNPEIRKMLTKHFLPLDIISSEKSAPDREFVLTTLGFPLNLGVQGRFSPISKRSRPASALITLPRFDSHTPCDFFLLEDPSIGGYSGAPVFYISGSIQGPEGAFMSYTSDPKCYGLMHGTLSDNTGGKIAAVTPAYYIIDLIEQVSATLNKVEKESVQ